MIQIRNKVVVDLLKTVLQMREFILKMRNGPQVFGLVLETLERLFLESKVAMDNGFKEVDEHSLVATAIVLFENEDGVDQLNKLE